MLSQRHAIPVPRLTDVTLMVPRLWQAEPDSVKRLYSALLDIGVLVQIPAHMAESARERARAGTNRACGRAGGGRTLQLYRCDLRRYAPMAGSGD